MFFLIHLSSVKSNLLINSINMKKFINLFKFSVLALMIMVIASCSKTENSYNVIPKNSTVVVVVNGKSISEKTGIENFTSTNTYALMKKEMDEDEYENFKSFEPIFNNTAESGIDFKKDYFFFSYKKENANYMAFYFNLLDASKFETTVNKINETEKSKLEIKKEGGFSYLSEGDDSYSPVLVWNDKQLLFITSSNGNDVKNYLAEAKGLLSQKAENSINENEDFSDFSKNQKDISLWMDYAVFYDNLPLVQRSMIQSSLPYDMTGTLVHAYVDFQKGKVVTSYDVVMNKEMKKFMDDNKLIKDKFDTDLLSVLPAHSYGNFSIAIDFLGYFNLIKDIMEENQQSLDKYDETFKAQTGMTITEALNEFSGEISMNVHRIAIDDVEQIDYMAYYQSGGEGDVNSYKKVVKKPVVYYSVAMEMNNDKLFNIAIQNMGQLAEKTGDYYTINQGGFHGYFGLFGKNMIFTNDPILISDVATGKLDGKSLEKSDVASHLGDFPTYAFVDLDIDNYPTEVKDALSSMMGENDYGVFSKMVSNYKKVEIIPKSMSEAEMILWMKDDSRNSLEVMLKSFDDNIQALAE